MWQEYFGQLLNRDIIIGNREAECNESGRVKEIIDLR